MIRPPALAALAALALPAASAAESHVEVTVSHGYSNFGELKYGPDEPFAYVNPDAPKGGELSTWGLGTFDSFNQFSRQGVFESNASGLLYEDLMISAADDPYGLYCNLCTTIEYPEDLAFVRVNLREDVRFSDGTPMTAEDLKFTTDLFLEQGIAEFRNAVSGYFESIEQTGPYQVTFTFTDEVALRERVGLAGFWNPFSKAEFEEKGLRLDESNAVPFMGTGPYELGEVDMGRSVVYTKVADWWGRDVPINAGRHNFDSIRIEYFADSTAALEGFKAGEYLFRTENTSRLWATAYDFPASEAGYVVREAIPSGAPSNAQGFVFNLDREPWQDARVRDAVRMMFNFEWSNESLFFGLYSRPTSFWGRTDLEATGVPEGEEAAILQPLVDEGLLDASLLSEEVVMPPVNDAAQNAPDRRARRQAIALLDEAGWTVGEDGLARNEAGETLELVIIQTSPAFDRIVNPYIENLRSVGIDARLERVDTAQYVQRRQDGDWDLTNQSPGQGFEPGSALRQWFGSETADDSSRNIMRLRDPAVDRLIRVVQAAETLEELRPAVRALDRVLRAQGFWIPQWESGENWVAYWDQYDHPEELPPLAVGVTDFWWFDEAGAARLREAGALN